MTFPAPEIITPKSGELFDQQVKLAWTKTHPFLFYYSPGFSNILVERGTEGTYISKSGRIEVADPNTPRITWWDRDGDGVRETPTLLLEPAGTNAFTWSEDLSQSIWTKIRSSVTANAATAPDGTATADKLVEDTSATQTHYVARNLAGATDNATQAVSVFARAGERTQLQVGIIGKDDVDRSALFDLTTGTVLSVSGATGQVLARLPDGWYRIGVAATCGAGASTPSVRLRLAVGGNTVYTGDGASGLYLWGLQFEADRWVASSYIRTDSSTATRAADVLTFPWPHAPQAMTGYLRFVERGAVAMTGASRVLFQIGTGTTAPRLFVGAISTGTTYRVSFSTPTSSVSTMLPIAPSIGSRVELLWRLYADGSVQIEQSIDGGTPVVAARSSAIGLPSAWSGQVMRLSGIPSSSVEAPAAWRDAIVLRGADWTMDQIRRLVA